MCGCGVKVLLDENLDPRLRLALVEHDVQTVVHAGWAGMKNGALLDAAEGEGYQVFLTGDTKLPDQQNRAKRSIAIIVLTAHQWTIIRDYVQAISDAIRDASSGSLRIVDVGRFSR